MFSNREFQIEDPENMNVFSETSSDIVSGYTDQDKVMTSIVLNKGSM